MKNQRQDIELADILLKYKDEFLNKHKLCPQQTKALEDIIKCRTSELGGHISKCNQCGHKQQSYNSCRNRHCPKCQFIKQVQWVDKLKSKLLPIRHFHLVFTIPQSLHKLFYINQSVAYSLLFKASSKALKTASSNPNYLGAQTGAVSILHTWGQTLTYHPHIHMIVPSGGLTEDGMEWISSSKKYLFPVKVLSALFRGILNKYLEEAVSKGEIKLPDDIEDYAQLKTLIYAKNWVVFAKSPFASADRVVEYFGNYTHRVAISNHRILSLKDGKVTFRYKNYRSGNLQSTMTLGVMEFIKRFVRHILPSGFYKIRYSGILSSINIKTKLEECFSIINIGSYLPKYEGLTSLEVFQDFIGVNISFCPKCKKGRMICLPIEKKMQPG